MSLIRIPDGEREPIYFESLEIVAVRGAGEGKTCIFLRGEVDGWKIKHPVDEVLSLIPNRTSLIQR